jgi:ABC-2 type transport system ATP-binding protein
MTAAISVAGLTKSYRSGPGLLHPGEEAALDDVNLTVGAGTITGLLGRNGAGKTTLLRILAGQEFPSSGSVRVLGAAPAENEDVLRRLVFVREDQAYPEIKVGQALRVASWFYPNWDSALASSLADDFGLRAGKAVQRLSRGQLSTHLIDEAAALFEGVIVIDRGRVVLDAAADVLRGVATRVTGPCLAVDVLVAGRPVWERRQLGSQASVVMIEPLSAGDREQARSAGLDLTPLSLQQIVVQTAAGMLAPVPGAGFATERTSA